MSTCTAIENVGRYHDDRLNAEERISFEKHLQSCTECQKSLSEIRTISTVLGKDPDALFSSEVEKRIFTQRLYVVVSGIGEQTRERFAYPLLAVAAVLLLTSVSFCSYFLRDSRDINSLAKHWVEYMVDEPQSGGVEVDDVPDTEENFAVWMNYALSEDYTND